jgi:hypothetical protein
VALAVVVLVVQALQEPVAKVTLAVVTRTMSAQVVVVLVQ